MRLYKLTLFLAILGGVFKVYGQDSSLYSSQIKFAPVKMINLINPGVKLAYELRHSQKFATQVSGVYLRDFFGSSPYKDYRGYKFLLEEKFYHGQRRAFSRYVSLETGYYKAKMLNKTIFVPVAIETDDDLYYESQYEDQYNLKRDGVITNAKYGMVFLIKRFTIDLSFGIGTTIHRIDHSNRLDPEDKFFKTRHINFYHMMEEEGRRITPNFPISVKFGYIF